MLKVRGNKIRTYFMVATTVVSTSCSKFVRPVEKHYASKVVTVSADTLKSQMLKVDAEAYRLKANKIPTPVDTNFVDKGAIDLPENFDYTEYVKRHPDATVGVTLDEQGNGVITTLLKQKTSGNSYGKIVTAFNKKAATKQTYYPSQNAKYSLTRDIVPLKEDEQPKFYQWAGKIYKGFYQGIKYTAANKK